MSTTEQKALALTLANKFDHPIPPEWDEMRQAATELRRLSAENEALVRAIADHVTVRGEYSEQIKALRAQVEALTADRWCPDVCPITGSPFFMWIEHWESGKQVPTYGGPYDSYTLPIKDSSGSFECERFDHDSGEWTTHGMGWHDLGVMLVNDQSLVVDPENPRYYEIEHFAKHPTPSPLTRPAVPDGWKLVPVEPTKDMLSAEPAHGYELSVNRRSEVWSVMLAASPQPEATIKESSIVPELPDGWVPCTITFDGSHPEEVAYGPKVMMDRLAKWLDKHFARAIEDAKPKARPTEDQVQAAFETWLYEKRRHGDVESVQRQWEASSDYAGLFGLSRPTEAAQPSLMSIINAQADEHAKRSPLGGAAQKGGA